MARGVLLPVAFAALAFIVARDVQAQGSPKLKPQSSAQQENGGASTRREHESGDMIRRRHQWFFKQRAYPLGYIPAGARRKALDQLDQMLLSVPPKLQPAPTLGAVAAPSGVEGAVAPPPPNTTTWIPIGPQPTSNPFYQPFESGRVTALAVDPRDTSAKTVYMGAADGGVWKTIDGGQTWTPLTDSQPTLAVGSIALDPTTNPTTIYVGTGEANFGQDNLYGAGVLKSTDGGATWKQDATFITPSPLNVIRGGPNMGALSVNPANNLVLLAGVQGSASAIPSGIWRSTDGGVHWAHVLPAAGTLRVVGTDVLFDPDDATGNTAYAGITTLFQSDANASNNGVYKSTDGGATWTKLNLGITDSTKIGRIALGISTAPGTNQTLYAAIADATAGSNNLLGVFKTTTGGTSWTQLSDPISGLVSTKGFCNSQCFFDIVIRVSPASPDVVFAGGAAENATLIRSTGGGTSWADVSGNRGGSTNGMHVDVHAIAFDKAGTVVYVGNDGGVWSSANFLTSPIPWTNLNATLNITQFYPGLSIHPSTPAMAYGGTQDNGLQAFNNDFVWVDLGAGCDGGYTAIDPMVPSTLYGECEYVQNSVLEILKSLNNGQLNTSDLATNTIISGINPGDRGSFIPPLVLDPNSPQAQTLYFGTFRVYQTTDGGGSWNAISPDLTNNDPNGSLTTIAVAAGNSAVVYTGADNGTVEVTTTATSGSPTWTNITTTALPARTVTQIVADASDATGNTAYATFSGFASCTGCDGKGHVFKTINGAAGAGVTWTDISGALGGTGSLPDIPVNDLVIDPDDPAHLTLYVATDIGVFTTTNGGTTWAPVNPATGSTPGLPRSEVLSLKLHDPSRTLRAATHGRGVWDILLPNLAGTPTFNISSISPATVTAGSAGFTLTVNGNGYTGSSQVNWNAATTGVTTTFVTANQLTASISATLVASGGTAQITVTDPLQAKPTNAMALTVTNPAPTISSISPTSATAGQASDVNLTVTGTNFIGNSQLQWDNSTIGVTTSFVSSAQLTAVLSHTQLLAFGGVGRITVFNPPPGGGTSNIADFTVNQTVPPPNDNFVNATSITSLPYTNTVDNFAATTESSDPTPPCTSGISTNPRTKTVWWKFTPTTSASITADTIGSPYDTTLSAWTGTQGSLTAVPGGCNDDIVNGVIQQSRITINVTAGTAYFFMVAPLDPTEPDGIGLGGKTVLNVSSGPGFSLSSLTGTQTVNAGQAATYTITVTAQNGTFSSAVSLSCSAGVPTQASCSFNPTSVTPGATSANSTLTITTTARTSTPAAPRSRPAPQLPARWLVLCALALLAGAVAARASRQRRWAVYLPLAAAIVLLAFHSVGCSGGGTPPPPNGTPAGTYTITVTGTSGSITNTTKVTLVVN